MYRSCGSFSETYGDDMALIRTRWQWLSLALLLVMLFCFPLMASTAWIRFATISGITIISVLGLQILVGLAGQVSVGQSAFMGIGAYFGAIAAAKFQMPFPLPIQKSDVEALKITRSYSATSLSKRRST